MQRYFIPSEQFGETEVVLKGNDRHHLVHVMRAEIGDALYCNDGSGRQAIARITAIDKDAVTAQIVDVPASDNEPCVSVHIAQSLPKGDKMETVIARCTEIGAVAFHPFVSERTIVQYHAEKVSKRVERWRKIAKESAEQARRNLVPTIQVVADWKHMLALIAQMDMALLCYEGETGLGLRTALHQKRHHPAGNSDSKHLRILLLIGPEGGFSVREAEQAERAGALSIHLGKRILRTETAAMVGLACILYEMNEMGGYA